MYVVLLLTVLTSCDDDDQGNVTPNVESLSDEERIAALDACQNKFGELIAQNEATAPRQLVAWLKTQSYLSDAGYSREEQTVWAHFHDGRFIMFVNNLRRVTDGQQGGRQRQGEIDDVSIDSGARPRELPSQKKVSILNGMGTAFIDPTNAIKQIFAAAKTDYMIEQGEASVKNLKGIGSDHAIFYLSTHGGADSLKQVGGKKVEATLGFWTTDECTVENEKNFKDDLDNFRLGYMMAMNNQPSPGKVTIDKHYAFTAEFVKAYMHFGENALIYFTACNGFREKPSGVNFRETVISKAEKQHAAYLGWTQPIYEGDGYVAAKFVFDRLLGANSPNAPGTHFPIPQEDPYQRSFDVDAVLKDMASKGLNVSNVVEDDGTVVQAVFKCYNKIDPDTRFILTPSISYLEMYEYFEWLYIWGIFGDDPGVDQRTVTIDGVEAEVIDWSRDKIQCKIKPSGKGSAGDVIVKIRDHQSNPRRLTDWRGQLKYTRPSAGSYKETTLIDFHIRRDVGLYRKAPATSPEKVSPTIFPGPARDTKANYTFGGDAKYTTVSGNCTYTYYASWQNGQGTLSLFDEKKPTAPGLLLIATERENGFELRALSFLNPKSTTNSVYNDWFCGDDGGTTDPDPDPMSLESPGDKFQQLFLVFDPTFNIQPGKIMDKGRDRTGIEYADGNVPEYDVTLEWNTIVPTFLPDPDQPQ
jgi:hypothetical protein